VGAAEYWNLNEICVRKLLTYCHLVICLAL